MLRMAIIGLGNRAGKYLSCLTECRDDVKICAVVEPDSYRLSKALYYPALRDCDLFSDADEFFESASELDAVIVASPDKTHYDYALKSIKRGWHVLLEKPAATSPEQCAELAREASQRGVVVAVCYVLRFHPFYTELKKVLTNCGLGPLNSVEYGLYVGIDRMTHSYVRGQWAVSEDSSPVILAKASHDVDMLYYLVGSEMEAVSSTGGLTFYKSDNAPEGAAKRCVNCPVERTCRYSAVDLYSRRGDWTGGMWNVDLQLKAGRFGRCVFYCDNDVADRQDVDLLFRNGVKAHLLLDGVSDKEGREMTFCFENGEVSAREYTIEVRSGGVVKQIFDMSELIGQPLHCGADGALASAFVDAVLQNNIGLLRGVDIASAVHSHLVCFMAEKSRKTDNQ